MREIKLTQWKVATIDDEDFEEVSKHRWFAKKDKNKFYAITRIKSDSGKYTTKQMHSVIMNTPKWLQTDHINWDWLCNIKSNLRICNISENSKNRWMWKNNTSWLKWVSWDKVKSKWQSEIVSNWKRRWLWYFDNKYDAYEIYCKNCIELHWEFAHL